MPSTNLTNHYINDNKCSQLMSDFKQNVVKVRKMPKWAMNEDIVISGISGRYPESDNIEEFADNLYNNIDMVVEDERRWPFGFLGLPKGSGKIKNISRFDADFFGISEREANLMDSQIRIMLELAYEAIWDSGIDPNSLDSTNTGTFIGCCFDETPSAHAEDYAKVVGYRQNFTGRLANVFNLTGPSKIVDTACASSFSALHEAMVSLRSNECERAIVAGINMSLRAATQVQFYNLNMISPDGHCKCLDETANGYAKGEACVVLILQKRSEAKRVYATILHTKTNADGFKELGITYPSWELQRNLIRDTYMEAGIDPLSVKYIEAHCTGTQAGDPVEMKAILKSMCSGRKDPLLVGALKSNIGHTEASSGLCSMSKVILSLENRCIPANLHMTVPNSKIEGLVSGILKPIIKNTPFDGELVGLNCFGFGGVNVHAIVKSHGKHSSANNYIIIDTIPRLVNMCGRSSDAVKYVFDYLINNRNKLTRDMLSLLNDISKTSPFQTRSSLGAMTCRGFAVLDTNDQSADTINVEINEVNSEKKPIWFVFSGMGSQWPSMAKSLISIETFDKSIKSSAKVLNQFNIDLLSILLNDSGNSLIGSPLYSFVSIAAIQIAFVDLLYKLNIKPDGIVGHSIGELACAYADGCLTAEETILMAYWRGKCIENTKLNKGMMAAVGLTWEDVLQRCPQGVFAACHNAEDSVTISGEPEKLQSFLAALIDDNIFARKVDSCGVAFHSPLIDSISEPLSQALKEILPFERMMSSKWISTTYPDFINYNNKTKYLSWKYFLDNLINPVLFYDAVKQHIPENAVTIEISPHSLLHPIIKRNLGSNISYIPVMKKNHDNNLNLFLSSIGRLYTLGLNPLIEKLYPKVEYPVSRGTCPLSPLVKWNHENSYTVCQYPDYFNPIGSTDIVMKVDLQDKEDAYLSDHCIDGRILFPATGYLFLVWKQLAKEYGVPYSKLPVEFEDVCLNRATILPKFGFTKFEVRIMKTNGNFVISESGTNVVTGRIFVPQNDDGVMKFEYILEEYLKEGLFSGKNTVLETKDIYKELRLRGYDYGPQFQCITRSSFDSKMLGATIKWTNNWVSFADCMIQTAILGKSTRGLHLPVRINSFRCDPRILESLAKTCGDEQPEMSVIFDYQLNIGVAKGLEFRGIKANLAPRKLTAQLPIVEAYTFAPNSNNRCLEANELQKLVDYQNACNSQAVKVAKKFNFKLEDFLTVNGNKQQLIDSTNQLNNDRFIDDENSYLFKFLIDLCDSELKSIDNTSVQNTLANKLTKNICVDLLNESLSKESFLRSLLEIVVENSTVNKINVLEVNETRVLMSPIVTNFINLFAINTSVQYSLLHPSPQDLPQDLLSNLNTYEWKQQKLQLPPDLNNAIDLVVYNDISISQYWAKNSVNLRQLFECLRLSVKSNGFVLVLCKDTVAFAEEVICKILKSNYFMSNRKKEIIKEAKKSGFRVIASKFDSLSINAVLLRKVCTQLCVDKQTFIEVTHNHDIWLEKLQNQLKSIQTRPDNENIWLISNDNPTNGLIGFVNCLRKESNGHRIRCVFNASKAKLESLDCFDSNDQFLRKILEHDLVFNVFKNDSLGSFRHQTLDTSEQLVNTEHCYLNVETRGDLSSLKWYESQHKYWPNGRKHNEFLCHVYYAPLNFRDIMLATGKLPADALPDDMGLQDCILGLEFSGRDENGNRVMGMLPSKGLATTLVMEDLNFIWPIPNHWSMEEASTVPVAYGTAYYALIVRGKLKRGESVLIHSGSGAVGQAAISISLSMDCNVFVTIGSQSKRQFLKNEFPKLCFKNFASSRDTNFESLIMNETDGRGVDVILNSLSEEKLQASLRCLATNGRFLEIGKYDLSQNTILSLSHLIRNKTFHGILLDSLLSKETDKCSPIILRHRKLIYELIKEGINNSTVKPMKRTIFDIDSCEDAFRYMASGKHIGKVVIKIRDEETAESNFDTIHKLAIPRTVFYPNKSYVITGGIGGFGLELANWMVERGATNLILTSRTGPTEGYQHFRINHFINNGVRVIISRKDASTLKGAEELINEALTLGPIGGIFNLAMVLSDGLFENQTAEAFEKVCAPKAIAVRNLDELTRRMCPKLDYFVAFSSVSCGRGNVGQTNYGYANSVMERVCDLRRADGYHGLAIQWGAIGDVGYVIDNLRGNDVIICGSLPQRMPSCMATLDQLIQSPHSVCSTIVKADLKVEAMAKKGNLIKTVAHILGLKDYTNLDQNITLGELGMDSLMGVEVKQTLERDYELVMSMQDIRKLSVAKLAEISGGNNSCVDHAKNASNTENNNTPVITIPEQSFTRLNDITSGEVIFILPPLDGSFDLLREIAQNLNRPAIGINWTHQCSGLTTIEETAGYFLSVINEIVTNTDNYDIIGYSHGGVVGFEVGIQLQKLSKKLRKLILLDSSPIQFKIDTEEVVRYHKLGDQDSGYIEALISFLMQFVAIDYHNVKTTLQNTPSTERSAKVSKIFSEFGGISCDPKTISFAAESYFTKLHMLSTYSTENVSLSSDVLLIRAKEHVVNETHAKHVIKVDYGLSEITNGRCDVVIIDGDHKTFLSNNYKLVIQHINMYLCSG